MVVTTARARPRNTPTAWRMRPPKTGATTTASRSRRGFGQDLGFADRPDRDGRQHERQAIDGDGGGQQLNGPASDAKARNLRDRGTDSETSIRCQETGLRHERRHVRTSRHVEGDGQGVDGQAVDELHRGRERVSRMAEGRRGPVGEVSLSAPRLAQTGIATLRRGR